MLCPRFAGVLRFNNDLDQRKSTIPSSHYPQRWDKFFTITKNWFSFVRPHYPDRLRDFRWSNYRKFFWNLLSQASIAELGYIA